MKYKFTGETRTTPTGILLHQIVAVRDVNPHAPAGTIGGWIKSERNLSHNGKSWVFGNTRVSDDVRVSDDALTKEQEIENRIKKLYGKCKTTVHWSVNHET